MLSLLEDSRGRLGYVLVGYRLCMQKQEGCFILKIFDCFMKRTIDLLYLLSSFYIKTYVTKPQTSRYLYLDILRFDSTNYKVR